LSFSAHIITLFPDLFPGPLGASVLGRGMADGLWSLSTTQLRDFATDRHRTVDDTPLGGGAGMVMRPDVWGEALDVVLADGTGDVELLVPTPSGEVFTQRTAERLAGRARLVVACGRYEGIDARVAEHYRGRGVAVTEVSIGDYVLNGGEVAALVVVEAVARLLPGVLGNPESLAEESHGASGLLEYPVYTRPVEWRGLVAPDVLLSGHHARIARWRRDRALERTAGRRPDLLAGLDPAALDRHDRAVLDALPDDDGPAGSAS
jgi:tRNA (guanine37-N1)-methyltransferase